MDSQNLWLGMHRDSWRLTAYPTNCVRLKGAPGLSPYYYRQADVAPHVELGLEGER